MNTAPYSVLKHYQPPVTSEDGTLTGECTYYSVAFQGNEVIGFPGTANWDPEPVCKAVDLLNLGYRMGAQTALLRNREPDSDNFDQQY